MNKKQLDKIEDGKIKLLYYYFNENMKILEQGKLKWQFTKK